MSQLPKITIITVVYNGKALIERTIKSVISQTYLNIEYLILDGGSTDGTLELAESLGKNIALISSGKDKGIYDAMNKGLKLATGDYVLFLNAGDELNDSNTLSKVFSLSPGADVYYGNTQVSDIDGKVLGERRLSPPMHMNWKSLKYGMCVSHQSFIAKRSLCPEYNLNYLISADVDWVIQILKRSEKIYNTHMVISRFLEGGASNKRRKKALLERFKIMSKHYGFFPTVWNHIFILFRYPVHKMTRKSMT
jgi:glycosyltransferase involved in cell wall biosynthesis